MAAFEAVSGMHIKTVNEGSLDIREARLPSEGHEDLDFDPRDHRTPRNPISPAMAYFNILRSMFGAGMLGMPLAVSQGGLILGPLIVLFTGVLLIHMHFTLLNCLNEIARQLHIPHVSYRYGFRIALLHGPRLFHCMGKRGPTIIAVFMLMSQLGICTVFVIFTSDNLRDIMDWQSSEPAIMALFFPYLIMQMCMKSLKIVSYVSFFGNFLNTMGLILVFYQIFKDPHGEVVYAVSGAIPVLFTLGTSLFNLCAVGVILSIDRALKNPRILTEWFGVLTIALGIPTIVSMVLGVLGYWSFGTMEENILRSLPFDETVTFVCIGFYMIAVALAFPIQCHPAIQMILEVVKNYDANTTPSPNTLKAVEWVSRPLFVISAFSICYLVPYQSPFVAFVGNLCTTTLALIFPACMELSLKYPSKYGKYNIYLIKNIFVIIIGMISMIFGAILCGYLMHIRILTSYSPHDKT